MRSIRKSRFYRLNQLDRGTYGPPSDIRPTKSATRYSIVSYWLTSGMEPLIAGLSFFSLHFLTLL